METRHARVANQIVYIQFCQISLGVTFSTLTECEAPMRPEFLLSQAWWVNQFDICQMSPFHCKMKNDVCFFVSVQKVNYVFIVASSNAT